MLTVIVPTFDRPQSLQRAVQSLFKQTLAQTTGFTLIVVDNTPSGSAAATLEALKRDCPQTIAMKTLHAPEPGVANARNAAMASGPWPSSVRMASVVAPGAAGVVGAWGSERENRGAVPDCSTSEWR